MEWEPHSLKSASQGWSLGRFIGCRCRAPKMWGKVWQFMPTHQSARFFTQHMFRIRRHWMVWGWRSWGLMSKVTTRHLHQLIRTGSLGKTTIKFLKSVLSHPNHHSPQRRCLLQSSCEIMIQDAMETYSSAAAECHRWKVKTFNMKSHRA